MGVESVSTTLTATRVWKVLGIHTVLWAAVTAGATTMFLRSLLVLGLESLGVLTEGQEP